MPSATEITAIANTCTEDAAWADAHGYPALAAIYRRLAVLWMALLA